MLILLLCPALKADEAPEWQIAVETLDRGYAPKAARLLEPIVTELEVQLQSATPERRPELRARLHVQQQRLESLRAGVVPHPGRQEAAWDAFCFAAEGLRWTLEKTQNVKSLRMNGLLMERLLADGRSNKDSGRRAMVPGVEMVERRNGQLSCYVISPDLAQSRCFIALDRFEGERVAEDGQKARNTSTASRPAAEGFDLLPALETKYELSMLKHEKELLRVLETHQRRTLERGEAGETEAIKTRMVQARAAMSHLESPAPVKHQPVTMEEFVRRIEKESWRLPSVSADQRLKLDAAFVRTVDARGKEVERHRVTAMPWPGLMEIQTESGLRVALLLSPDLEDLLILPYNAVYEGKRLD